MDQELISYLDERFRETAQQIQSLREETTQQIQSLREETTQQIQGTSQQIQSLREETTQQIQGLRQETAQRFERVEDGIRHTQISIEGLRGELRIIAEGVMGMDERLGFLKTELKQDILDVKNSMPPLFISLDKRVRILEHNKDLQRRDPMEMIWERYGPKPEKPE